MWIHQICNLFDNELLIVRYYQNIFNLAEIENFKNFFCVNFFVFYKIDLYDSINMRLRLTNLFFAQDSQIFCLSGKF